MSAKATRLLEKTIQNIEQLAAIVNTLSPGKVRAEDFTEAAREALALLTAPKPKKRTAAADEYTCQPIPNGPAVVCSDKPLSVGGITTTPKWRWSTQYRQHYSRYLKAAPPPNDDAVRTRIYLDWYAGKHDIDRSEAAARLGVPSYAIGIGFACTKGEVQP